ncbi:MAG: HAD family hydrolase [Thermoanaerobaculia bacterium]
MIAIFDVDGTLTESQGIDNECFVSAFASEFGIGEIDTDWALYPHTTDRGLTGEILRRALGREPEERELVRHRTRLLSLLRERTEAIGEIAGARRFLEVLMERGWRVVLATGAWSESARIKLQAAGFPGNLPLASCDGAVSRTEIVQMAIHLGGGTAPIVLFGDAVWDVRAAVALNLPIVGVGSRAIGATRTIEHYLDVDAALRAIDGCKLAACATPKF